MKTSNPVFLMDANSFITPYQLYYPFDLAPNFWRCMENKISDGSIVILDKVYDELIRGGDALSDWIEHINPITVVSHKEPNIIKKYGDILTYIQTSGFYKTKALTEWADINVADPWLIACADVLQYTIVTFEKPNGNLSKTSPSAHTKIPDVCKEFGVENKDLFYMMRTLSFNLS